MPDKPDSRGLDLRRVDFTIPSLREERLSFDLSNSLMAISGVGHIDTDLDAHRLTVEYDPHYTTPIMLRHAIVGSGYPVEGDTGQV